VPRIDIELTSTQSEGTWTWRAAGARQPKGVLDAALLEPGAKVGDVVRAECEIDLDGTRVTSVLPSRAKRAEPDLLPIQGSGRDVPLVTQDGGAPDLRGDRPRREGRTDGRGDRRPGRDRDGSSRPGSRPRESPGGRTPASTGGPPRGPGGPDQRTQGRPGARPANAGERRPRSGPGGDGERRTDSRPPRERSERPRRGRPEAPPPAERPRHKRLQPARVHREAVLAELPPEQRAVAEKVLRGGIPSVRQAVEEQNAEARSTGAPEVRADALVAMAESLQPRLRAAEWRDRAEAASADVDEIGLRDLRAVVAGSDAAGRDDESRALVVRLREALERRGAEERDTWMAEIRTSLSDGRVVRALRLSGRPPDPAARFPAELGDELSTAAGAAMTADTVADRWAALLDAVVASPVRRTVKPEGVPAQRPEDFERALRLAAPRVPALAAMLGPPRPPRPPRPGSAPGPSGRGRRPRRDPTTGEPGAPAPAPEAVDAEVAPLSDQTPVADQATPVAAPPAPGADEPVVAAPVEPAAPVADEPTAAEETTPVAEETPPPPSGDDGDDAVLVEELR